MPHSQTAGEWVSEAQVYFYSPQLVCSGACCVSPLCLAWGSAPLPTLSLFSTPQPEQSFRSPSQTRRALCSSPTWESLLQPQACLSPSSCLLGLCICRSPCLEHSSRDTCVVQLFLWLGFLLKCHLLGQRFPDSNSR